MEKIRNILIKFVEKDIETFTVEEIETIEEERFLTKKSVIDYLKEKNIPVDNNKTFDEILKELKNKEIVLDYKIEPFFPENIKIIKIENGLAIGDEILYVYYSNGEKGVLSKKFIDKLKKDYPQNFLCEV